MLLAHSEGQLTGSGRLAHEQSSPLQLQVGAGHCTAQSQKVAQLAETSDASCALGVRSSSATVLCTAQPERVERRKASAVRFNCDLVPAGSLVEGTWMSRRSRPDPSRENSIGQLVEELIDAFDIQVVMAPSEPRLGQASGFLVTT